jgi:hypothetical protein
MIIAKSSVDMYSFDFSTYVSDAVPAEGWIDWRVAGDVYADFLVIRTNATTAATADTGSVTNINMIGSWAPADTDTTAMGLRVVGATGNFAAAPVPIVALNNKRSYIIGHEDGDLVRCGASYPTFTHDLGTNPVGIVTVSVYWCLRGGER